MRIPPSDTAGNDSRPICFGLGLDPDSQQRTPVDECRRCSHVAHCALLRLARFFERDATDFGRVYLNAKFPYGKPTDRWRPRG